MYINNIIKTIISNFLNTIEICIFNFECLDNNNNNNNNNKIIEYIILTWDKIEN